MTDAQNSSYGVRQGKDNGFDLSVRYATVVRI